MSEIIELGTDPMVLYERNREAYEALPECYKNDNSLDFFVDVNGNICAEHVLHDESYIFIDGKWQRYE